MTPPVKVLVDSTAGISPELATAWGVGTVPLYLQWGDQDYRDGTDILPNDFYALLARRDQNPVTAAPNPQDFTTACREALALGYQGILIVTVSVHMSATYQHACLAAEVVGADTVAVLDSGHGAGAQALIAAYAAQIAKAGGGLADIVDAARTARDNTRLYLAVNTLKYLRRSGRISNLQATMGEFLQLKPILTFCDGRLQLLEKPRTMRRAVARLLTHLIQDERPAEHILVMYGDTPSDAVELTKRITLLVPDARVDISPVSYVVGGHTGPGLLGFAVRRGL